MPKYYKVIARSANDEHYERSIGTFMTEDEAKLAINLWEAYGPYDFIGLYEIYKQEVV